MNPLWFPAVLAAAVLLGAVAGRAPLPSIPPRTGRAVVVAAAGLYAWYFWGRAVRGVEDLLFGYDLAHVMNILWNTREGRLFHSSFLDGSILGHHLYLWLLPISWLSNLWPSPLLPQALQIAALALTAPILHAAGRRLAGEGVGVAVALAFLLHAGTHGQTQSAFDPAALGTPFVALAILLDTAGRPGAALAALAAALPAKEHYAGVALVWGLVRWRRWPRHATGAIALGLVWAGLYVAAVRAFPVGETQAAIRLAWLGEGLAGVAAGAVAEAARPAKIGYLLHLLAPFGFLPLVGPAVSALALPEVAIVLVATFPMHHLLAHYTAATVAPLAAGAAAGAARALAGRPAERRPAWRRGLAVFILTSAVGHAYLSGLLPPGRVWRGERTADRLEAARRADEIRRLAGAVPPGASVGFGAEAPMLLLADRPVLYYPLPYARRLPPDAPDFWFLAETAGPPGEGYIEEARGGGYVVWRRAGSATR